MSKTQKGIRVYEEQWQLASSICGKLNTNLSAVINQLIAQIIIQEKIPFELYLNKQEDVDSFSETNRDLPSDTASMKEEKEESDVAPNVPMYGTLITDEITNKETDIRPADTMVFGSLEIFGN